MSKLSWKLFKTLGFSVTTVDQEKVAHLPRFHPADDDITIGKDSEGDFRFVVGDCYYFGQPLRTDKQLQTLFPLLFGHPLPSAPTV